MGQPNDDLGTEDWPRLNLGSNLKKMLNWPNLYAVRIECQNKQLMIKILTADIEEFRIQVIDYFAHNSKHSKSTNLQYHVSRSFDDDSFSGENSLGQKRKLKFKRLIAIKENDFGKAEII